MAADANGNDIEMVDVPISGSSAYAPYGTTMPTAIELGDDAYVLPVTFKRLGLRTTDGAPEWVESRSDSLEFFEDEFELPAGTGTCDITSSFAQYDTTLRTFMRGVAPDVNGVIHVDVDGTPLRYVFFTEELMKSGRIRRRIAANAWVRSVTTGKPTRGNPLPTTVTLRAKRHADNGGGHFVEAVIEPA